MSRNAWLAGVALLLGGCASSPRTLMPLEADAGWEYRVRSGFVDVVRPLEVAGPAAVGSVQGMRLSGPMGVSTLAWQGSQLLAGQLAGTRYEPPLPLLDLRTPQLEWKGDAYGPEGKQSAQATIEMDRETIQVLGREVATRRSVAQVRIGSTTGELTTWFAPGRGVVRQEWREGARLMLAMDALSGP